MYAPVILIAIVVFLVWPMLGNKGPGKMSSEEEPLDEARLRALGYMNLHDRWVHPSLRLWTPDPKSLLKCDKEQLEVFHNSETWVEFSAPDKPFLSPDVGRVVRELQLTWFGWLDAWFFKSGVGIRTNEIESLGGDGLKQMVARFESFHKENQTRKQVGCFGLALMFFWLVGGWQWGPNAWLVGMAAIAVGSWLFRPIAETPDLWGEINEVTAQDALLKGRQLLGEEWREFAYATAAIPIDKEHLHLMNIEKNIAISSVRRHFTPDGITLILKWLVPIEDDET